MFDKRMKIEREEAQAFVRFFDDHLSGDKLLAYVETMIAEGASKDEALATVRHLGELRVNAILHYRLLPALQTA